ISLIYPFVPGIIVNADEDSTETNRTVRLVYEREDQNYEDWDVWVWNTGVKEDDIQFDNYDNGVATAFIEVAPHTSEIGYIVRKNDWSDREPNGVEVDRFIPMNQQDSLTKAYITQGEEEVHIVPGIPSPTIEKGTATFYYRDKELYLADQMDQIEKVELVIDNETLEM